jgi:hypothetical protein
MTDTDDRFGVFAFRGVEPLTVEAFIERKKRSFDGH